jgi:hypothetical protein
MIKGDQCPVGLVCIPIPLIRTIWSAMDHQAPSITQNNDDAPVDNISSLSPCAVAQRAMFRHGSID